ncbi:uncharacterized protein ACRADG_008529 [Cochliomyia hominivorax]
MSSNDLSSKCRTCLSASKVYHQLFDYVEENYKILEMLDGIVPQIDIKTSSQFSTLVCDSCVEKLLTGYKFQQLCIETNNRLHDLLGLAVFETQPKLEKILDPLTGEASFKMKEEIPEEFVSEIPTGELSEAIASDNEDWAAPPDDDGGGLNDSGSDTDSSNEKLSVLKERSTKKSPLKVETIEKSSKINRRKGNFPCAECAKVFGSINRLKQHTAVHEKKRALSCEICNISFSTEKSLKAHTLTHTNGDISTKDSKSEDTQNHETDNSKHKSLDNKEEADSEECKDSKQMQIFQCPDCPKVFEKKASLSAHYKVHKKKELINNKSKKFEQANEENNKEDINENDVIVKEEIEITPQIFEEPLDDIDEVEGDWFNNDYDESDGDPDKELFVKPRPKETNKNIDFIDTGVGEIEKPNSSNKRSGQFPCKMCGKVFDRPYRLKRHSSVHSPSRPHECEICKYRFATLNILKSHIFQHENETGLFLSLQSRPEGFKCPDCPRRFEKQASLSAHRQIHTRNASESNGLPCMVCQRNFMSVRSLTEHITNKHPEVEKHKCDQCDKTFVLHAHLVEHLNRHKGNRNLVCLICEKEFGYTNTLKEHMRTHSGESPYLCPQCGKTFRSASNLRQHMERHTGLKKYQCSECPSRFNCRSDLIKHASTHSNAKPHVCDICGSRFTRAYSLQKHKVLHTGERPFKCDQCNMTFAIVYHLRRHMRTHTGEKPYKCKYCERAYAESGDLTKHLRTHVGENTYMCDQCPMAFKYQAELRHHQSQHYKMAQKLLQQAQKMSEDAQQEQQEQLSQTQLEQQQTQLTTNLTEQSQQLHNEEQQLLKNEQIQNLPLSITSYQQIPLIHHRQQLTEQTLQHHEKIHDSLVMGTQTQLQSQQDNKMSFNDLFSKCRTCLSASKVYHQLFDYVEENYKILEMLEGIVPQIDIKTSSQFSTLVCDSCVKKLLIGYKFQQLCIETNKRLHDFLVPAPKLEKNTDPLTDNVSFKIKVEIHEVESEMQTGETNNDGCDLLDDGGGGVNDSVSDTDSSNEKLSVLKKRSIRKTFLKKSPKQNRHKSLFPSLELITNKHIKLEETLEEDERETDKEINENNVIVKEEIEVTPQIFEETIYDNDETEEAWCYNDYEKSDGDSDKELLAEPQTNEANKNIDFIDTGVGEVEKPNNNKKRGGQFPCKVCGKVFDRAARLERHNAVHSPSRQYECKICKYRFGTLNVLNSHITQHEKDTGLFLSLQTRPEGFQCPDCPRRFEKQASLSAHRQIHKSKTSEFDSLPCTICQRQFKSVKSLTEHITRQHPEMEKHKCDQCDKTFVLHAHLVEHLNRHKGNRSLVCLVCEKEFGYMSTLKEHMRTHSGESPFLCPQCGKTFRSASNLRQHIERHSGLKKYQCPECPGRFNCSSDLKKHISTHSNARPHVCDICGSRFTRAYALKKHKELHSGKRPFKCDQCHMTFAIVYHLRRHIRTHTGEKPFKCKYCERAYAESGDLTTHLRTHIGDNIYMCDQCPMTFKYQTELKKHQSQHYKAQREKQTEQPQKQLTGDQLLKHEIIKNLPSSIKSCEESTLFIADRQQLTEQSIEHDEKRTDNHIQSQ